jgi:signal transduction histidine kinase
LATVHGIVRSVGGAIDVISAPGAGSTFDILFPSATRSRAAELTAHTSG